MVPAHVELRRARLCYSAEGKLRRLGLSGLLDDFVALADPQSGDHDILKFAKQYGPLYLCKDHGLVSYHKPLLMSGSALGPAPIVGVDEPFKYQWCAPRLERQHPRTFSEPLERWRVLAMQARHLLLAANAVRSVGDAPPELWEKVDGFSGSFRKHYGPGWAYLDQPWPRLAANLDYWIVAADVGVRVSAENHSLVALLGSNPFVISSFGLVAIQLLLAITRAEGLASCSGCGAPYMCSRPPLAGKRVGRWVARRNYCQRCRDAKLPQRDAARDYRKRSAERRGQSR